MAASSRRRKKTSTKNVLVDPVGTSAFEEMERAKAEEMAALKETGGPSTEAKLLSESAESALARARALYGIPEGYEPQRNELGQPIMEEADFYKHSNCVNTIKWVKTQIELRNTQLKLLQVETQRKVEVLTQNLDGLRETAKKMEGTELADIGSMLGAKYGVDIATSAIDTDTRALISEQELQRLKS